MMMALKHHLQIYKQQTSSSGELANNMVERAGFYLTVFQEFQNLSKDAVPT